MYTISMCECVRARALRVVYVHMYVSVCRVHMHAHNFTAICVRECVCVCACVLSSIYFHLCGKEMQSKRDIDEIHKSYAYPKKHLQKNIINLLFVSVV